MVSSATLDNGLGGLMHHIILSLRLVFEKNYLRVNFLSTVAYSRINVQGLAFHHTG